MQDTLDVSKIKKRKRPGYRWRRFKDILSSYAFLMPNFIGFIVFILGPVIMSFVLSLYKWDLLRPPTFVGLSNYVTLLLDDELFWITLKNTFYFIVLTVPANIVVSLTLAVILNRRMKGIGFFRTAYFIPVVSSLVAVAVIWRWLYQPDFGLLNGFLYYLRLPPIRWLRDPAWAMPAVALMSVWKNMGYNMVIFLAGLQGIPMVFYEAAKVDGANHWHQFRFITLPLLSPAMFFVMVISLIGAFQAFDQIYIMTQGGPGTSTMVYNYYLYRNAFFSLRMGYASAMAYIMLIIIFAVTIIQIRLLNRSVQYGLR